jgi:uncharacterized membrane protein
MRRKADAKRTWQDRAADKITNFSGSMVFVWLHVAWFGIWIAINLKLIPGVPAFDEFPFGLLTMIVSLEAIFLSTFVLISQNREAQLASHKEALDLTVDLLSEYEITHTLRLLRKISDKLGIECEDEELGDLCEDIVPEELIEEVERADDPAKGD